MVANRGVLPTIWEFMSKGAYQGTGFRSQALAKSIALEATLSQPAKVYISTPDKTVTLTLNKLTGTRSIEIKNRELEEIFLPGGLEVEREPVDLDFRYMYRHAYGYDSTLLDYPLPHLIPTGGAGNEVGTCGGNRFSGFSSDFTDLVKKWNA
jgi:hypothetical protein